MIQQRPITQQEIDQQLSAFVLTQKFNIGIGLFMVSLACFLMTFLTVMTSRIMDNTHSTGIWIVSGLMVFVGVIVLTIKFQKFRTIFKWGTLPLLITYAVISHEKNLLITVLVLTTLIVVYILFKISEYYTVKDNIQDKKKTIMTGIVTYCAQEDRSISVRIPKPYWVLTVVDGEEQLTFSLSNMDVLRLYWSGKNKTGFVGLLHKEVEISFIPELNKVLSICLTPQQ